MGLRGRCPRWVFDARSGFVSRSVRVIGMGALFVSLLACVPSAAAAAGCYDSTYTVPANVNDVDIVAIGQGGTTGNATVGGIHGGGVGGSGDLVHAQYVAVTPGEVLYYGAASPTVSGSGSGSYVATAAPSGATCLLSPSSFLVVAAGGGGGGDAGIGGAGGSGGNAEAGGNPGGSNQSAAGAGGSPGAQTAGGAGGAPGGGVLDDDYTGGAGAQAGSGASGCAPGTGGGGAGGEGGGGWWGGGGGGGEQEFGDGGGGGGGGSSYVSPAVTYATYELSSAAASVTITPVEPTSVDLVVSPDAVAQGSQVKLTARVLPATATGTVIFTDDLTSDENDPNADPVSIGSATVSGGIATLTFTATAAYPANTYIVAHYSGDTTNSGMDSASQFLQLERPPSVPSGGDPSAQTVTYGQSTNFFVEAQGQPYPAIQWEISRDSGATWSPIAGATSTTYAYTPHVSESGDLFRALFTNAVGNATTAPATLTVIQATLDVIASSPLMGEGGSLPAITGTFGTGSTGFVNGDTAASLGGTLSCGSTPAESASLAVGEYPTDCSGLTSTDYDIVYVPGTLSVTKDPLRVTANNETMTYGGTVPALSASYSGFVGSDGSASLGGTLDCTTTATSASPVVSGGYPITCTGQSSGKYDIKYVSGTLTVTQATPDLNWALPTAITYGTALSTTQLDAKATGVTGHALPGTFSYSPVAGTVLHAGTGQTLLVTFTPTDATDYTSTGTTTTITVNKAPTKLTALGVIEIGPALTVGEISATLQRSDTQAPIPSETVTFTTGGKPLCSATSNTSGVVTCKYSLTKALRDILALGYVATFAGDGSYVSSNGNASLVKIAS